MDRVVPAWHVVLVHPEIPQNTGNIGRTCVAVGAKLWLVRPLGFRLDESRLRRAGLDYWDHLQWEAVDDWPTLQERLTGHRFWYFTKSADREFTTASFHPQDVLVFGSETQGLPPTLLAGAADRAVRIPLLPPVRSLNLATAVALGLYEARRQYADAAP
ncbi:MAG: tRNA (cytidine(34)-2'-O)-methyltransferase [Pirellulaceae bacterium]